jgi:arabinogalactan endo-1,4-beta-galactosidase
MKDTVRLTRPALGRRRFLRQTATGVATLAGLAALTPVDPVFAAPLHSSGERARRLVLGHDLSTLQQEEDAGNIFTDLDGHVRRVEDVVARHGATYIRERLWVNPPAPYNDLAHILSMARRIKRAGLKLLLDFHYSDFWADPGKQNTPQSWQGQDLPTLANTVYNYTRDVLRRLAWQGTPAAIVQTGNEVTAGMLWPVGQLYVDGTQRWPEFTTLLKAAIAGVRDSHGQSEVMVHIDRGGDNGGARYFYDNILAQGVDFDLIGLSYYSLYHGPLSALQANLNDLALRYHKDIVVVETAYPWTFDDGDGYPNIVGPGTPLGAPYPASPDGQLEYLRAILSILDQVPDERGRGLVYWESAWIPGVGWEPGAGDAWDNMTLFDFKGHALSSIRAFEHAARP